MGFIEAVGGWFVGAAKTVAGGAEAVYGAIKSVYSFSTGIFDAVKGAWAWVVNGLKWLGDTAVGALARVLHLLEWLALHAIPEGLAWVVGTVERWATGVIHLAEHVLKVIIGAVRKALEAALHQLESWARAAVKWLTKIAGEAWQFVETTGKRVADLVLHPDKLAAWLVGALVLPLLRFLIESSAGVIAWLLRAFVREAGAFAKTLEDVLSKVV